MLMALLLIAFSVVAFGVGYVVGQDSGYQTHIDNYTRLQRLIYEISEEEGRKKAELIRVK